MKSLDCSDDVCGYKGVNSTINMSGSDSSGFGNNSYYMRFVGTTNIDKGRFPDWGNLYINSYVGSSTFSSQIYILL